MKWSKSYGDFFSLFKSTALIFVQQICAFTYLSPDRVYYQGKGGRGGVLWIPSRALMNLLLLEIFGQNTRKVPLSF